MPELRALPVFKQIFHSPTKQQSTWRIKHRGFVLPLVTEGLSSECSASCTWGTWDETCNPAAVGSPVTVQLPMHSSPACSRLADLQTSLHSVPGGASSVRTVLSITLFFLVALSKLIKVAHFAQEDTVHASGAMLSSSTTQTHTGA